MDGAELATSVDAAKTDGQQRWLPRLGERGWILLLICLASAAALLAQALRAGGQRDAGGEHWPSEFWGYIAEMMLRGAPYIVLGAVIAALAERYLPEEWLPKLTSRLGVMGIPATALLSAVFPSCECGVVSIGRSLLRKGLPLPHTLTYLLAAPILNPTVLLSTWAAFHDWQFPLYRALGGALVAVIVGLACSRVPLGLAFRPLFQASLLPAFGREASCGCCGDCGSAVETPSKEPTSGWRRFLSESGHILRHVRRESFEMAIYFLMGVYIAAAMHSFVPTTFLSTLSHGWLSAPLAMMATAFLLSLCSEADAFPAASFSSFGLPAQMAFLVFGPMFDIKLLLMYRSVFRSRFIALLSALIFILVLAYSLTLRALLG